MKLKRLHFIDQKGSTSIQWVIISLVLFSILFIDMFNTKSVTDMLEGAIKKEYQDQVFSGALP